MKFGMACAMIVAGMAALGQEPVMDGRIVAGTYAIAPDVAVSGVYGTWVVTYTAGAEGIAAGGGIRVELPDEMHAGPRNSAYRVQASDPAADQYVTASCSREGVEVRAVVEYEVEDELVKHAKPSLDGRMERYVFVVRVEVVRGALTEGDTISVVYGDTRGGSRGYRAGEVSASEPLPVLMAVDGDGDQVFQLVEPARTIRLLPGLAAVMLAHVPSQAVAGEAARALVAMVDAENNPIDVPARVRITVEGVEADAPEIVELPAGQGYAEFTVTPARTGTLRVHAWADDRQMSAVSNPCVVRDAMPERRILWGELHSHTHYSWDGVGRDHFAYARYVSGLDFYAVTDHAMEPDPKGARGLHAGVWHDYTEQTRKHHDPPAFVTLHAYECSFGTPYGHHNVFFRDEPGALLNPHTSTLPELWGALEAGNALTIPHHTGKFPRDVDLGVHHPEFRRNFEIYSGHGLSEVYNPTHPLAFEYSWFTGDARSQEGPSHAQDVWARGLYLSTVASSDDHRAQPGKPFYGLTAIYATENTRDAVFQGLYDRRTYGTTGAKIILDFTLNGAPMGSVLEDATRAAMTIEAIGTDAITLVEVLRHRKGEKGFEVIRSWTPNVMEFSETAVDEDCAPGNVYYVRLRQANDIGGRIVMAWSSPVWIATESGSKR